MTRSSLRRDPARPWRGLLAGAAALIAMSCSSAAGPAERVIRLEVAEQRAPCMAVGPSECLQVREGTEAAWQLFYGEIEGFSYEPGYRYVLEVAQRSVANPPADGSSLAYRLVHVVSKTPSS